LGERVVRNDEVRGSIPLGSTKSFRVSEHDVGAAGNCEANAGSAIFHISRLILALLGPAMARPNRPTHGRALLASRFGRSPQTSTKSFRVSEHDVGAAGNCEANAGSAIFHISRLFLALLGPAMAWACSSRRWRCTASDREANAKSAVEAGLVFL
jgi:hypothetical protein